MLKSLFKKINQYLIIINLQFFIEIGSETKFCKHDYCHLHFFQLKCYNYKEWSERNLENSTCYSNDSIVDGLEIKSEDFSNLKNNLNKFGENINFRNLSTILMYKVNKFSVNKSTMLLNSFSYLYIISSIFTFYNENDAEINLDECDFKNFNKFIIFKSIYYLVLEMNVQFNQKMCPLMFLNSDVFSLQLVKLTDSFIQQNKFQFLNLNHTNINFNLSSTISRVVMAIFDYKLDNELLNKEVFKNIRYAKFKGTISNIDKDTFSSMKSMKKLVFFLANLREFFHSGTEWFNSLTTNLNVSLSDSNLNFYEEELMKVYFLWDAVTSLDIYDYPNEDFCLIYKFPIERLIVPILNQGTHSELLKNCSCSIIWLLRYSKTFEKFVDKFFYYQNQYDGLVYRNTYSYYAEFDNASSIFMWNIFDITNLCLIDDAETEFMKCDFSKRLADCENATKKSYQTKDYDNMFKLNEKFLTAKFIISIIFFPVISFLSFIANFLCAAVIIRENFKDPIYKYLKFNSIFNSMYCFLMTFRLIVECFGLSSIFCSNVYYLEFTQYFKIIFILYFGNVLKLLSNITFLSITISRYIMVSNEMTKFKFLNSISSKKYLFSITAFSLIVNLNIFFHYQINDDNPYHLYPFYVNKVNKNFVSDDHRMTSNLLFNVYNFLQNFLVYGCFLIPNFIFDIYLYLFLKKTEKNKNNLLNLKKNKKENYYLKVLFVSNVIISREVLASIKKNQDKTKLAKKKITYMILINGIDFIILRLPEIIIFAYGYYYNHIKANIDGFIFMVNPKVVICTWSPFYLCDTLTDIFEICFVLSIFTQVFIYYYFNLHIKDGFSNVFKIKKR